MVNSSRVVSNVDIGDDILAARLAEGLARVETLMSSDLSQGSDDMVTTSLHLAHAGGKRFRPLFALLAASVVGGGDQDQELSEDAIKAATIVEMIHLATLYHDDVMDEAAMRRGVESANSRWGNNVAILAGDYLFAHASALVATLGVDAVSKIAETFAELVTGQMQETKGLGEGEERVDTYLQIIHQKTASLIGASGWLGGYIQQTDSSTRGCLERLGIALGMAFQIVDDVIDISSASCTSGKTPGTDLREGVHTLPMLYALHEEGPIGDRLRELLVGPISDEAEVAEALTLLAECEGLQATRRDLKKYVDEAYRELDRLPQGKATVALRNLIDFTVERVQ